MTRRTTVLLLLAVLLGGLVAGGVVGWGAREATMPPPALPPAGARPALDALDAHLVRLRAALERLPEPSAEEEARLRRPRTPSYTAHLRMADSLGVPPVRSEDALAAHVRSGALIPLVDNDFYAVRILEHSKPFLVPMLQERLDEVGRRFQEALAARGLPRYRYVVSSALRTADLQQDLARTNRNAVSSRSSHESGVSVDIVFTDYAHHPSAADTLSTFDPDLPRAQQMATRWTADLGRAYHSHLFGAMARVLHEMQEEGLLLVLLESEQPVFHITVATPALLRAAPAALADAPADTLDR
jgi:hypothetical protein